MDVRKFIDKASQEVVEWYSNHLPDGGVTSENVFMVWSCKTLQHNKGLFGAIVPNYDNRPDSHYFEVTYNGDKNEMYVDVYMKESNKCVTL